MNSKQLVLSLNGLWVKLHNRSLVWDTITTTGWGTLGKAIGFLIPFFIAAWFGVTSETDAFFFAYGLILFLSGIFAPIAETIIIPYIAEARAKKEDVGRFIGKLFGVSCICLLALSGLFLLIIKPILSLITHFDSQTLDLVYLLLIEIAPLAIFLTLTSILAGALNAYKKFTFPALSPAFRATISLIIIFIFKNTLGIHSIALGYIIGEIFRLIILAYIVKKLRLFKFSLSLYFDPKILEFLKTVSYQMIGAMAMGLSPIVDKTMATWLGKGSVSILYYADRLYCIPLIFISMGLMVVLLSHWSNAYYEINHFRLKEDIKKIIKIIGFISFIIMLFLILFNKPIVKMVFGRGKFNQEILSEIGWVWICYLFGFVPHIIGQIFVRAHLIIKNTKALMNCAFFLIFIKILLNYILMGPFKIAGLAIANSITPIFTILYLGNLFYKMKEK